jgi:hypothetical protein
MQGMTKRSVAAVPKAAPKKKFKPLISDERVLAMHAAMLRMRDTAEAIQKKADLRRLAGSAPLAEGSFAGLLTGASPKDLLFAPRGMWQVGSARGEMLDTVLPRLRGSDSATEVVVADVGGLALVAIAAGAAAVAQKDAKPRGRAVVVFAGDVSQDEIASITQFASHRTLPLIVVSLGRLDKPTEATDVRRRGAKVPMRLPQMVVDGCDPMAVQRVSQEALTRVRSGLGGAFIRCILDAPGAQDPVATLEQVLRRRHLFSENKEKMII